jgi:hypothetical protein
VLNTVKLSHPPTKGDLGALAPAARPFAQLVIGTDTPHLAFVQGVYELALTCSRSSDDRIREFQQGETEFGVVVDEPLIVLCFRIGKAIPWSSAFLDRPADRRSFESPVEERALLCASLFDRSSELPRASRNVTLSLGLTRALKDAACERERYAFDPNEYRRVLSTLRRRYPTTQALLTRAIERSTGFA